MNPFILAFILLAGIEFAMLGLGLVLKKLFPNLCKGD